MSSTRIRLAALGATLLGALAITPPAQATDTAAAQPQSSFAVPCERGWACLYPLPNFEGTPIKMYDCKMVTNPFRGTGSWVNNQPSKYHVKFYDHGGNLGWTSPGGYSEDRNAPLDWFGYISAC
ncbi:hypothetical protein GCM10010302_40220 [Streptomyces polychromogenes]|uniref:Peptidase inhibitor family I36 n=1 Tax=Streptomyces polychromogenes TaxID=67342 RepID=A0ABP3F4Z2_9ACTN